MTERKIYEGAAGNRLVADVAGHARRCALLLHGGGQTRHAWDETARRLAAAGWSTISLDQRGHGESDWVEDGAYAFTDYAADAAVVAKALSAEYGFPPVVIGASLGGIAALLALGARQPPFAALVLVDVVPRMDPAGVAHVQGFMRAHAREGFATIEAAADAVAAYLPHRPRPKSLDGLRKNLRRDEDGRWRWHWDPRFLDGPRNVNTDWEDVELALEAAARRLSIPTLLVRGGSSELVPEGAAQAFLNLAPQADYADVADARHMVAGDRNDVFADAVLTFLKRYFA
jgi:pimeloyl-ACP methyl ester carboxylesterase